VDLNLGPIRIATFVLPKLKNKKISRVHCALTFDDQRRLILRDLLGHGTIVEYDGRGGELRRTFVTKDKEGREKTHHFKWILSSNDVPRDTKNIVIHIQGISFQIEVSTHDQHPWDYNTNVDRFLQQAKANDKLSLSRFSIKSLDSTAAPSRAETPSHDPIHLKQETLRSGSFTNMKHYWDVSSGFEYAYKEPANKNRFKKEVWKKETLIIG
jgi:hypothetical protein